MAIVQISKIQQRAGNLVDLPQLDNGEFGWATDENRLFIGRTGNTYADENIEVLTSYSNISFSQINGSDGGNFNVTVPLNGQILTYVSSTDTWENYTGLKSQLSNTKLQLGNVANLSMTGGAIGYILETDGAGNLSWTPKNTLYTTIKGLTNNVSGNVITMTVSNLTPYTNGQAVTITGAIISNSGANSNINGNSFYVKLNGDFATSGNVVLYTNVNLLTTANGAGLVSYTANSGVATAALGGGGTGSVGGSNTTVQFNDQNISNGVAAFTFDKNTTTLTLSSGNVIAANINATIAVTSPILVSNITTGTSPLTVTSTTLVPNLFVARANVSEYANTALTTTGTWYPIFVNATLGNLAQGANANLSFNAATGNLTTTLLNVTSNANTGNLGTTTLIATTGNITTINSGLMKNSTSNITIASAGNVSTFIGGNATAQFVVTSTGANISGTANVAGNANVGNLGTATAIITTGNITTINSGLIQNGNSNIVITANANISHFVTGNATSQLTITATGANIPGTANVTGNANVGNLGTAQVLASANITTPQFISNIATGTAPLVVTSTTRVANLNVDQSNIANYANVLTQGTGTFYPTMASASSTANYQLVSNANLSFSAATGTLSATLFAGNGSSLSAIAGPNVTGIVANANVSTYEVVTNQSTGIYYPTFVNANTTGNYQLASNTTISANLANGALIATTFVGNILGNIGGILANGTSNVSIPTVNGNINLTAAGNTTMIVTGTGANITGTLNTGSGVITGNGSGLISITGANVTGQVNYAGTANSVAGGNVSGAVSYATTANAVAGGNVSGAVAYATTANAVAGGNVSGTVANATYAVTAGTANAVAGGNVSGAVAYATTANSVAGGNVSGAVAYATTANSVAGGNVSGTVSSATTATTAGTVTTAAQGNITSVGTLTSLSVSGQITNANLTTGAESTAGTITGNWTLVGTSRLQATYADLAEYYEADKPYEPGTVLEFGGDKEVTIAEDGTTRVAGVVSTNPAYVMNSQCQGEHIVALALQGRVPVKVRGTIHKGDMLVSGGEGYARPMIHPYTGSVIGKSLENFEGEGIIEVAVGRL